MRQPGGNILLPEQTECDDCGMIDARWACVTHGTLLCDECAGGHRSLGRHVSQIRCLNGGAIWSPSLWSMMSKMCVGRQANRILESEVSSSRWNKPYAFDDFETKLNFIRQKYEHLAFVNQAVAVPPSETRAENDQLRRNFVSQQLRCAVQTDDIARVLWLLLSGADPNYSEGTCSTSICAGTPITDAIASGRSDMIELLCLWGGDPCSTTCCSSGHNTQLLARTRGYNELAERLAQLEWELVDRILEFVYRYQRRADLVEWQPSTKVKEGRKQLSTMPDIVFVELVRDVFDEIDRRDNNQLAMLLTENSQQYVSSRSRIGKKPSDYQRLLLPFLPVNPHLSATRNQGRQKLARMSAIDFFMFLRDIVSELRRRRFTQNCGPSDTQEIQSPRHHLSGAGRPPPVTASGGSHHHHHQQQQARTVAGKSAQSNTCKADDDDDQPIYDHVASDDEDNNEGTNGVPRHLSVGDQCIDEERRWGITAGGDEASNRELKLRVMRLESQLQQLTCVNEDIRHQMLGLKHQLLGVFSARPLQTASLNATAGSTSHNGAGQPVAAAIIPPASIPVESNVVVVVKSRMPVESTKPSTSSTVVSTQRISQNFESDYDNTTHALHTSEAGPFATTDDMNDTALQYLEASAHVSCCHEPSLAACIMEEAIMEVIHHIGLFHDLIKRKQRSEYMASSEMVDKAVCHLCNTVLIAADDGHDGENKRVSGRGLVDIDRVQSTVDIVSNLHCYTNKLRSIVASTISSSMTSSSSAAAAAAATGQQSRKSPSQASSSTAEHTMIDCCYQIGCCTKSLVATFSAQQQQQGLVNEVGSRHLSPSHGSDEDPRGEEQGQMNKATLI